MPEEGRNGVSRSLIDLQVGFPLVLKYSIGGVVFDVGGTITSLSRGKKGVQVVLKDGEECFTRHIPYSILRQSGFQ